MPIAGSFNIPRIEDALNDFFKHFPKINKHLSIKREDFTKKALENILEAYEYLNSLIKNDINLFSPAGQHSMLEMNHLVLCGSDSRTRMEYYRHIDETRKRYSTRIKDILKWTKKHFKHDSPYKLALGFYTRSLSQPQLFIEGNHRTGNILLNYLLVSKNVAPYVITSETAHKYLEISGDIKFSDKENFIDNMVSLEKHKKRFQKFLEIHADNYFLT